MESTIHALCRIDALYTDLNQTLAKALLERHTYPWEALAELKDFILELQKELPEEEYIKLKPDVFVAKSAKIYPNTYIEGPTIIGPGTQVRPGAFIRGVALVGENCVVGNSTELKQVILFNHVQVPHYNYVGDSILGYGAHMGAGSITSNVKGDKCLVKVKYQEEEIETGMKKFGAMLGDGVEVGCNTVLNPGTVVGAQARIYPLSMVRGVVPTRTIYKRQGELVDMK